jgi:hypothetical protein
MNRMSLSGPARMSLSGPARMSLSKIVQPLN